MTGKTAGGMTPTDQPAPGRNPLPRPCPITPLGVTETDRGERLCLYQDAFGGTVGIRPGRHGKLALLVLFGGDAAWLEKHFPLWVPGAFGECAFPENFNQDDAARALIEACCAKGIVQ